MWVKRGQRDEQGKLRAGDGDELGVAAGAVDTLVSELVGHDEGGGGGCGGAEAVGVVGVVDGEDEAVQAGVLKLSDLLVGELDARVVRERGTSAHSLAGEDAQADGSNLGGTDL